MRSISNVMRAPNNSKAVSTRFWLRIGRVSITHK